MDAVSVLTDNTVVTALESVVKVCQENKIPLFAGDTDSVERGAIAAYAFDLSWVKRLSALHRAG